MLDIPWVAHICAVFMDFLLQVTAFVALIVFDFRRAQDGRIDCVPCARIVSSPATDDGTL